MCVFGPPIWRSDEDEPSQVSPRITSIIDIIIKSDPLPLMSLSQRLIFLMYQLFSVPAQQKAFKSIAAGLGLVFFVSKLTTAVHNIRCKTSI